MNQLQLKPTKKLVFNQLSFLRKDTSLIEQFKLREIYQKLLHNIHRKNSRWFNYLVYFVLMSLFKLYQPICSVVFNFYADASHRIKKLDAVVINKVKIARLTKIKSQREARKIYGCFRRRASPFYRICWVIRLLSADGTAGSSVIV